MDGEQPTEPAPLRAGATLTAKYAGPCLLCTDRIEPGDAVARMVRGNSGEAEGYAHYRHTKGPR